MHVLATTEFTPPRGPEEALMRFVSAFAFAVLAALIMATSALAANPGQISLGTAKVLVGGPFVHGPNVQVYVSIRHNKKRPTQVITDCANAPKTAPVGLYIFTPFKAKIYDCAWQQ